MGRGGQGGGGMSCVQQRGGGDKPVRRVGLRFTVEEELKRQVLDRTGGVAGLARHGTE